MCPGHKSLNTTGLDQYLDSVLILPAALPSKYDDGGGFNCGAAIQSFSYLKG